jgi:hypothetical protein
MSCHSRAEDWIPLKMKPHMPNWPTTSYNGLFLTKNSSVALARITGGQRSASDDDKIEKTH